MSTDKKLRQGFHDKLFERLLGVLTNTNFFVGDHVESKLHEAVDEILDDPRNAEAFEIGVQFVEAISNATPEDWAAAERAIAEAEADQAADESGVNDAEIKAENKKFEWPDNKTKPMVTWCETNECELLSCHRCFPRKGCTDHDKCREFTAAGNAYSDQAATEFAMVVCKFCDRRVRADKAHLHQGSYVGDECGCWDDRLKATE